MNLCHKAESGENVPKLIAGLMTVLYRTSDAADSLSVIQQSFFFCQKCQYLDQIPVRLRGLVWPAHHAGGCRSHAAIFCISQQMRGTVQSSY